MRGRVPESTRSARGGLLSRGPPCAGAQAQNRGAAGAGPNPPTCLRLKPQLIVGGKFPFARGKTGVRTGTSSVATVPSIYQVSN